MDPGRNADDPPGAIDPYGGQQQQSFHHQQQLSGFLPAQQQQPWQQQYYAAAYEQQQLMAQQLMAQLDQQQQATAPNLRNPQYNEGILPQEAFRATSQQFAQQQSNFGGRSEESSPLNQFDEEDEELNLVNEKAVADSSDEDDVEDLESDAVERDVDDDDENDETEGPAEEKEGYFTPTDDTNQDDEEVSLADTGKGSTGDDEIPGSEDNENVAKTHLLINRGGKSLASQIGGKGLMAQRGGKSIALPQQYDEKIEASQDNLGSSNEEGENSLNEEEIDGDDNESDDEDLSQDEEEDNSQQEDDDLAEQEEEETISQQGEEDLVMQEEIVDGDDDDENDPSDRKEDEEMQVNGNDPSTQQASQGAKRKAGVAFDQDTAEIPEERERKVRERRGRGYQRLLSDSIRMYIPINVTADLGVAIKRTKENRIGALYEHFPELKPKEVKLTDNTDEAVDEDGEEQPREAKKSRGKKRQKLKHVPQPNQFASMIDYLEAKYVQGVMVADEDDADDEEGGGSVYSETSFLDDTGLQRTVAEQVMGHATTTKLELEDDDAFFVNVGDLEVEESDMTKKNYDPLKDVKDETRKKRKKVSAGTMTKNTKDGKTGAAKKSSAKKERKVSTMKSETSTTKKEKSASKSKAKAESASNDSTAEGGQPKAEPTIDLSSPVIIHLKNTAERMKTIRDSVNNELVNEIKSWDDKILPKKEAKPSKVRVAIRVPDSKKAGDSVSFVNPHRPDQKLRTTIPEGVKPNSKFYVQIPAPEEPEETGSSSSDHNKIPRESYDKIDEFARAYDDWADAEGAYRKAIKDKDYSAHKQKRLKFDDIVLEFPKDLRTPIDKAYMQRIIRRARQNKHKRALNEAKKRQEETSSLAEANEQPEDDNEQPEGDKEDMEDTMENESDSEESERKKESENWKSFVPKRGRLFPSIVFDRKDF